MPSPKFTGDYAADGKADRAKVREEAGHRCIRCGHPYVTGLKRPDKGQWSECDAQCTHGAPVNIFKEDGSNHPIRVKTTAGDLVAEWEPKGRIIKAEWRILTVHHFDGAKDNDAWFNKLALCQKCHLTVQTKVNPEIPWMLEHSDWMKPYVAGFYALKYLRENLTREEVMARLEELLQLERKI